MGFQMIMSIIKEKIPFRPSYCESEGSEEEGAAEKEGWKTASFRNESGPKFKQQVSVEMGFQKNSGENEARKKGKRDFEIFPLKFKFDSKR